MNILFLTGKMALQRLHKTLDELPERDFEYEIRNIGVNVASLMTAEMIGRRLEDVGKADQIIVPGLCRGDLQALEQRFGIPVTRGCNDLKDLPVFFGHKAKSIDLSRHDVRIFAEIVEAAEIPIEQILQRALAYTEDGADVIDLGCLPGTDFPHLEEAVVALKEQGYRVSVDSLNDDELLRGGSAGADYLLSLKQSSLWIAEEVDATPVLIPENHPDPTSVYACMETLQKSGKPFIADTILDPIHFGFTDSVLRYVELRKRFPKAEIMMGIGNLTELTEADTSGINAILFGIISELGINNVLATEVSPHACRAIKEADFARRMLFAAREESSLPKGIDGSLLTTHERYPFPYTSKEISEFADEVKDPSYRIQVSESEINVYNRDGLWQGTEPFEFFNELRELENDPSHAFYMGVELARAQIALQLGKRYWQDRELNWGVATKQKDDGK